MLSLSASGSAQWGRDYTIQADFGYGWRTIPPNNRQWGKGIFAVEFPDKPLKLRVVARLDNQAEGDETITIGFDPDITLLDLRFGGFADASHVTAQGTVTFTLTEGEPTVSISAGPSVAESESAEFTLKSQQPGRFRPDGQRQRLAAGQLRGCHRSTNGHDQAGSIHRRLPGRAG